MSELPTEPRGLEDTVAAFIIRGVIITGATCEIIEYEHQIDIDVCLAFRENHIQSDNIRVESPFR